MALYDIDWFKLGLNALENQEESEITVAKRIKIRRYSADCKTHPEKGMNAFMTEFMDLEHAENYKGSIGIIHGMAQCSDSFYEIAFHLALNGFIVHLVDLEGFGFTSGCRIMAL